MSGLISAAVHTPQNVFDSVFGDDMLEPHAANRHVVCGKIPILLQKWEVLKRFISTESSISAGPTHSLSLSCGFLKVTKP